MMKFSKIFSIFITSVLLYSCASKKAVNYAAFDLDQTELDKVSNRLTLCSQVNEKKDPADNPSSFEVKDGKIMIVYVSWFDLPNKNLCMKVNLLSADNKIIDQDYIIFNPHQPVWYCWIEFPMQEYLHPVGDIKVQVFLNNHLIKETITHFTKAN